MLEELHDLGVRLTLDDFGTGYSSPLLVVQYPFDTLKIDRSFVIRVLEGQKERAVTAAIVTLAHGAGMTVVAEGVESREQLRLLRELGADEIQGYFFSPPIPRPSVDRSCKGAATSKAAGSPGALRLTNAATARRRSRRRPR